MYNTTYSICANFHCSLTKGYVVSNIFVWNLHVYLPFTPEYILMHFQNSPVICFVIKAKIVSNDSSQDVFYILYIVIAIINTCGVDRNLRYSYHTYMFVKKAMEEWPSFGSGV